MVLSTFPVTISVKKQSVLIISEDIPKLGERERTFQMTKSVFKIIPIVEIITENNKIKFNKI